ncbi:hypothetical protein JS530_09075 [Bifidobacterium sp. LC6]|uniref:Uncharacterized protein n=1 Tax=Bifidobacterium colobi TaxID=2809026 RepID=A0ABS5UX48_9BIFI|nr:hypothetical protein [Bifidobacterium colobi]MBT1175645.1 hypothetical protein [Bifidobacterium colobi]
MMSSSDRRDSLRWIGVVGRSLQSSWKMLITLFAVSGVIAVLLFSNMAVLYSAKEYPSHNIAIEQFSAIPSSSGEKSGITVDKQGIHVPAQGGDVQLHDLGYKTKTLHLESQAHDSVYASGSVSICDASNTAGRGNPCDRARLNNYAFADSFRLSPHGKHNSAVVRFNSTGNVQGMLLHFNETTAPYTITSITANPATHFTVSIAKWLLTYVLLVGIYCIVKSRAYAVVYDWDNRSHNIGFAVMTAVCMLIPLVIRFVVYRSSGMLVQFPSNTGDQYALQLEAWKQGSLSLVQQPPKDLLQLDNPYSLASRVMLPDSGLYDVVLFNGKYWTYFGVTPLLLVYLPFNALFPNRLPADLTVTTIFACGAALFLCLAVRELLANWKIRPNYLLLLCSLPALCAGSLIYFIQSCSAVYYIPLLCAIMCASMFIFFGLRACRANRQIIRSVLFVCSGIALALQLGSRPNSLIGTVCFMAPLFIGVLLDKQRKMRGKLIDAGSFLIPTLLGFAAQLWYNKLRFGSLFNFGNKLQVTIDDLRDNALTFDPMKLKDMILDFFLLPFKVSPDFPYISYQTSIGSGYGNYAYLHYMFGIGMIPLVWFVFAAFRKVGRVCNEKAMVHSGLVGCLVLTYINYAIAGSIFRYYCDFLFILLLIAVMAMLRTVHPNNESQETSFSLYVPAIIVCVATVIIGLLLVFSDHPELVSMVSNANPDLYVALSYFFDFALGV